MSARLFGFVLISLISAGLAQLLQGQTLSDTPVGKRVQAYLEAFNAGTVKAYRSFFASNISPEALQRVPLDQRIEHMRQLRAQTGTLELRRVGEQRADFISVIVRTERGDLLRLDFAFEPLPPQYFTRLSVKQVDSEQLTTRATNDEELIARTQSYLDSLSHADAFSGVVLIARAGKPLWEMAYGLADRERNIPNRINTKFNIGSINKTFTALAIHQLAAEGKLSLSDPLKTYLPEYPNRVAAEKVTVQHLLEMTSGIGDIFGERYRQTPKENLRTLQDYLPLFADQPLQFEPGSSRRYSNGSYIVLGLIIEKITGMDYYTYIRDKIFRVAGMNDTDWFPKDSQIEHRAVGYLRTAFGTRIPNTALLPARGSSAGGGYSTAHDLLKFTLALSEKRWNAPGYDGFNGLGVAGGSPGLNAALEWDGPDGYAVIVLSNDDPPSAERVARLIRSWLPR
jgi:D-alanyl-D-alanine carboxypeptidase